MYLFLEEDGLLKVELCEKLCILRVPIMAQGKQIQLGPMRMWVPSLTLLSGLRIPCCLSCGVGHRCSSDLALLWLWYRPGATAPIWPLAWEALYAVGVALKRQKKKKKKKSSNFLYCTICVTLGFFKYYFSIVLLGHENQGPLISI